MLANVVSVVGRVEDIGVVPQSVTLESGHHPLREFINCLYGLKSPAVILVCVSNLAGV